MAKIILNFFLHVHAYTGRKFGNYSVVLKIGGRGLREYDIEDYICTHASA